MNYLNGEYFDADHVYSFSCRKKMTCLLPHKTNGQVIVRFSKLKFELEEYMTEGLEQVEYNVIDCELEKLINTPQLIV